MGIYGSYAKELINANNFDTLAENMTIEEVKNNLLECYSDLISVLTEDDQEVVEEGANLDMTKAWMGSKKEVKQNLKAYKKYLKAKDYKKASAELDKVIKILEKAKKEIKNVDQNAGSAIIGFFADLLVIVLEMIVPLSISGLGIGGAIAGFNGAKSAVDRLGPALNTVAGITDKEMIASTAALFGGAGLTVIGTIWTVIKGIMLEVKEIKTWIKEFKSDNEKLDVKHFNLYRNTLIRYMDTSLKKIDALKRDIPKLEKK